MKRHGRGRAGGGNLQKRCLRAKPRRLGTPTKSKTSQLKENDNILIHEPWSCTRWADAHNDNSFERERKRPLSMRTKYLNE